MKRQPKERRPGQTANEIQYKHGNYNDTEHPLHDAVRVACDNVGIGPLPPSLPLDGEIRCPDIGKGPSNQACWILFKQSYAYIHCHASGYTQFVFEEGAARPTRADLEAYAEMKRLKQQAQREAAERARKEWERSTPCTEHPYCTNKNIDTHGCRVSFNGDLVVPLCDVQGRFQSLQRISPDGQKRYWKGAAVASTFFLIGEVQTELIICEGFATGATLFEELGKPVACAMDAGNLKRVAQAFRARHPKLAITIAGDNDRGTPGNPGRTKALEAAGTVVAKLVMPDLCPGCACTDFNDQANCRRRVAL